MITKKDKKHLLDAPIFSVRDLQTMFVAGAISVSISEDPANHTIDQVFKDASEAINEAIDERYTLTNEPNNDFQ